LKKAHGPVVLGIDTSGRTCQAALCVGEGNQPQIISEDMGTGHAERLISMLQEVLKTANTTFAQVDMIAVCTGPGSFAGVRCGIAAARGLALSLSKPAIGINALDTLEPETENDPPAVIMNAKRDQFYWQCKALGVPPELASAERIVKKTDTNSMSLCGSGALLIAEKFISRTHKILHTSDVPDMSRLITLSKAAFRAQKNTMRPQPLYLREPDAKPQTGFALERTG